MLRRGKAVVRAASIQLGSVWEISYHSLDGAKFKGPSMSIRFEGKPPSYLGIAEGASAHALDGSVVATKR